ncbi:hypothetical protein OJF2_59460 [Aquisphaera giovannonii]|uniref:Uncharacterized protein n=1 Tax=Aquisphaera giovannonii TaxID=406548 RepID=A0A5B9WA04_9BACT|nr:hypothetical protein [Aquisphaera giovannonii]QEH37356.1 hypothetical protein OJF2_59460 [Aquisphaera giovannonii]
MSSSPRLIRWFSRALIRLGAAIAAAVLPVVGLGLIIGGLAAPFIFPRRERPGPIGYGMGSAILLVAGWFSLRLALRLTSWLGAGGPMPPATGGRGRTSDPRGEPLWDRWLDG